MQSKYETDTMHDAGDERAAIFDHTVRSALFSSPHLKGAGCAKQHTGSAQGNTQDMEATLANLLREEPQGCSEARRPPRPAPRIKSSEPTVTSSHRFS